jgi:hypothetical protein
MSTVEILGLALGSAWTSGINLYATVAALGVLQRLGLAQLPGDLDVLSNGWIISLAAFLYFVEFIADKVPYVDSVWDVIHTFIRVPAGAVLALSATTDLGAGLQVAALLLGGTLALSTHGTKTATRAAINTSPEPFSNWVTSLFEDVVVFFGVLLAIVSPVAILAIILIFIIAVAWFMPKIVRRIRKLPIWSRKAHV